MNTNKIDLIKAEVERLKSQLLRGACSSQIAMETRCKEEAYDEVLAILDTMQEEPVSEELEEASEKCIKELIPEAELNSATPFALEYVVKLLHETFKAGANWQKEKEYTCYEEAFEDGAKWKKEQIEKVLLSEVLPCFMHGGEADEVVAKLDEVLNQKK